VEWVLVAGTFFLHLVSLHHATQDEESDHKGNVKPEWPWERYSNVVGELLGHVKFVGVASNVEWGTSHNAIWANQAGGDNHNNVTESEWENEADSGGEADDQPEEPYSAALEDGAEQEGYCEAGSSADDSHAELDEVFSGQDESNEESSDEAKSQESPLEPCCWITCHNEWVNKESEDQGHQESCNNENGWLSQFTSKEVDENTKSNKDSTPKVEVLADKGIECIQVK